VQGAYIPAPASTTLDLSMLEQWSAAHPEVRQRARERWTKCTLEEWQQGAEGAAPYRDCISVCAD
jgi:DNA polymerase IIIc chi subunit